MNNTNLPPDVNQQSPPSDQNPFFSSKNLPFLIIYSLILIILSAFSTYFILQSKQSSKPTVLPTTIPTHSPTPSSQPDETASWKTYTSSMNITFRYPPMWYVSETGSSQFPNLRIQNYDPATAPDRGYDSLEDKGKYVITVNRFPAGNDADNLDQLITKLSKEGDEAYYLGEPAGKIKIVKTEKGEINGFPMLSRTISYSKLVNVSEDMIYLLNKKGDAIIVRFGLDVLGGKKILNQILSTFRFLDQN